MNMGKKITELTESSTISGESSYPVSMGDGTGVKQVKHKNLVEQLLSDMELPYDATLAMLMETETDEEGNQKIPNLQAISDWIMSKIVNNLLATEEGFFLDARIGRILDQRISANANAISQINSDLLKMPRNIIRKVNASTVAFTMDAGNYLVVVLSNVSGRIGFTAYICGSQYDGNIASTYSSIVKIFDNSITESNVSATKDGNTITITNEAPNGSFITVTKL